MTASTGRRTDPCARSGSGISIMSDSLIAFQPAIDEPSNMMPSAKVSSSTVRDVERDVLPLAARVGEAEVDVLDVVVLDHLQDVGSRASSCCPSVLECVEAGVCRAGSRRARRRRRRRKRAQIASLPVSPVRMRMAPRRWRRRSCRRRCGPVWAPCGWPRRRARPVVGKHDLDLHLGQEVDDVFGAAIELGVALLAAEALGLGHGDALQADLLQRFLHLVELERLDDRFDLFHFQRRKAWRFESSHPHQLAHRSAAARREPKAKRDEL
jgi:hypothetical protein